MFGKLPFQCTIYLFICTAIYLFVLCAYFQQLVFDILFLKLHEIWRIKPQRRRFVQYFTASVLWFYIGCAGVRTAGQRKICGRAGRKKSSGAPDAGASKLFTLISLRLGYFTRAACLLSRRSWPTGDHRWSVAQGGQVGSRAARTLRRTSQGPKGRGRNHR